jgi:type VI secretion system protein ImpK
MRDALANVVYPIFLRGLNLKEQLERGLAVNLEKEQGLLKGLLNAEGGSRLPDFSGGFDPRLSQRVGDQFSGIRYALVCWLDEIFSVDCLPARQWWTDHQLEPALFGGAAERAWRFWEQARRAETREGDDALEGFYLCVMLGFRGKYRPRTSTEAPDDPGTDIVEEEKRRAEELQNWVATAQRRLARSQATEAPLPSELEPPINVPPLRGWEKMQGMVFAAGGAALLLILAVVIFATRR